MLLTLPVQIANEQAGVTGQLEFKLWFNEGGCHTFLRVFFNAMEQLRAIPIGTPMSLLLPTRSLGPGFPFVRSRAVFAAMHT